MYEFLYYEVNVASEDITAAFVDIPKVHSHLKNKELYKIDLGREPKNDRFYKYLVCTLTKI